MMQMGWEKIARLDKILGRSPRTQSIVGHVAIQPKIVLSNCLLKITG